MYEWFAYIYTCASLMCSQKPWNILLLPFFGTRFPPPPFRSAVVACPPRSFPGSQARLTASWDKLLCMSFNTTAIVNIGFQLGSRTFYTVLYQTTDHLTGLLRIPHWGREAQPKNRLPGQSNGLASGKGGLRHWKALEPNKCRHKGDRDETEGSILKIAETKTNEAAHQDGSGKDGNSTWVASWAKP